MGLFELLRFEHEARRHADRPKRVPKIMTQDREEHLLRVIQILRVARNRFGERLVDRLVESRQIVDVGGRDLPVRFRPESDHAGAQGAVLGDHLFDRETAFSAASPVFFGRRRRTGIDRCIPLRFLRLLMPGLRSIKIRGDHRQHLVGMVAERHNVHRAAGGCACPRECFPLR